MPRIAALLLVLTLGSFASRAAVRAEEAKPPPTADEAALAVAKAWEAKDVEGLKALAARDAPDPWLVADSLLYRGKREAAEAFARAAPRKDVDSLPDFVTTWSNAAADTAAREALVKINAGIASGRGADALAAADGGAEGAMPFLRLRLKYGSGLALRALGRNAEAADRFCAVAMELEGIGWLNRASASLRECIATDVAAGRGPKALETAKRMEALAATRGSRAAELQLRATLAVLYAAANRWDDAHAAATRLVELFREEGNRPALVESLNDIAWYAFNRRNVRDLESAAMEALGIAEASGDWPEVARSEGLLALGLRSVGRMTASVPRFRAAAAAAEKSKNADSHANFLLLAGRSLGDVELHEEALEPLRSALTAFEAMGPSVAAGAELARARLAWSLLALHKLDEARPLLERALAAVPQVDDPVSRGFVFRAEARRLALEGKVAEAVAAYRKAYEAFDSRGEGTDARMTLLEVAELQRGAKDLTQARTTVEEVLTAATKSTDDFAIYKAQALGARIAKEQGETARALDLAKKSLTQSEDRGDARASAETRALLEELTKAPPPR